MTNYQVTGNNLSKSFGRRLIFKEINFHFEDKGIFGIAGNNGSGKSTLAKIIAGILTPTNGKLLHQSGTKIIKPEELHNYIGFCSPYLVLYDEFTAEENLKYFSQIRGINYDKEKADHLLNDFLIYNRRNDEVKVYSSGMKQRLKFIFALMHSPSLVILDEPTSNLDNEGKDTVYKLIKSQAETSIILIASNELNDLELCDKIINLEQLKTERTITAFQR